MSDRALILDFGSVISLTMFETHHLSEQALGLPAGSLTWPGPFDPANDPLWQDMQADRITERDYWLCRAKEVGQLLGEDWTQMVQFVQRARGENPMRIIRPQIPAILDAVLAAGHRLAILSNELDLFFGASIRDKLPFLDQFDVISDATYTRILKPDPQAYTRCLDELGLAAKDCVFIDDQKRNVAGAIAIGLPAFHLDVRSPMKAFNQAFESLDLPTRFDDVPVTLRER